MKKTILLFAAVITLLSNLPAAAETWEGESDYDGERHGVWTRYTDDETLWETISYRHGALHGVRTGYYPDGSPSSIITYQDGVLSGTYTTYYDNDSHSRSEEGDYADDRRTGPWMSWHPNGQIKTKSIYFAGQLNGLAEDFYSSGGKQRVAQFRNNQLHGPYTEYYDNIENTRRAFGEITDDKKTGEWTTWHANGNIESVQNYYLGTLNGRSQTYFVSGRLAVDQTYKNNVLHGRYLSLYEVDYHAIDLEGRIIENERNGLWLKRAKNGNIIEEISWERGTLSGMSTFYHEGDGVIDYMLPYEDGILQGEARWFFHVPLEAGVTAAEADLPPVSEQGNYRNGKKTGLWRGFFEDGEVRMSTMWGGNMRNGLESEYDIDVGTFTDSIYLLRETNWVADKQEGLERLYYPDSSLRLIGNWRNDYPEGEFVHYYDNGEISNIGSYVDGKQEGVWREYDRDGTLITIRVYNNDELVDLQEDCDNPVIECVLPE